MEYSVAREQRCTDPGGITESSERHVQLTKPDTEDAKLLQSVFLRRDQQSDKDWCLAEAGGVDGKIVAVVSQLHKRTKQYWTAH